MSSILLPPHKVTEVGEYTALSQSIPWGVHDLDVPKVWTKTKGRGAIAVVIDSGFSKHPDNCNEVQGPVFVSGDKYSWDMNGHGSHVAGIIGACDDESGMVGVAPEATVVSVKGLNQKGVGDDKALYRALEWALDHKPDVVNLSVGAPKPLSRRVLEALEALYAAGVPVVVAAGNHGKKRGVMYPARWPMTFGIAAYDAQGKTADFSAAGPEIDFAAPGVGVLSTFLHEQYATMDGTSMAAPFVTGVICLMVANARLDGTPYSTVDQIRRDLIANTRDVGEVGHDHHYGFGIIEPSKAALTKVLPPSAAPSLQFVYPEPKETVWSRFVKWVNRLFD